MAGLTHLLPSFTFVKYHSGTATQRKLLKHSGLTKPDLAEFPMATLLPEVHSSGNSKLEPLLLHALDDISQLGSLARLDCLNRVKSLRVFVNGKLEKVSRLVDSKSSLTSFLFAKQHGYADYTLLPDEYATEERLAVLKAAGLPHEDTADHTFALACCKQFIHLCERGCCMDTDIILEKSKQLADMLQRNLDRY